MRKNKKIKLKVISASSENYISPVKIPVKISLRNPISSFSLIKKSLIKITAIILILGLNWSGLSAIISTFASFNDTESSLGNSFTAGTLDFALESSFDFLPTCSPDGKSQRTIKIINYGNVFKYLASSTDFSSPLCDYLTLEANVDGGQAEYLGPLNGFNYGILEFSDPDEWQFKLSINSDLPKNLEGKTCTFKFIFDGSQTRNNLPFGQGFSDIEEMTNNITAPVCRQITTRSCGYWKNHSSVYQNYLPQVLGDYPQDEIVDTVAKADSILKSACGNCGCGCDKTMRAKLKGQLLAMKFNIAHFGIGDYFIESENKTLNEIVAAADTLLRQNPAPPDSVLEEMKNLLDNLNSDYQMRICSCLEQKNILINKVYYDVDSEHGLEPDNEWVELYNPNDFSVDISGFQICNNNACDTISNSSSVPALGFALISFKDTTWDFWQIPDNVVKIALNSKIGDGLGNNADMLILKDADGNILDQMNWGTPNSGNSGWQNYNESVWNPGVPDVPEGHILSRVPTGYDTDQSSDWHNLALPEVQVIWPNGNEILYVGRTYTLKWTAVNHNGLDSDLKIDIWYSKDSGNSWASIVKGTENDGSFDWRIPLCLDDGKGGCYYTPSHNARIKVMAFGPENFMVQDWDMSDNDFCPPIDYSLLTPEEIEILKEMGLWQEDLGSGFVEEPIEGEPAEINNQETTTTTEISSTTEEIISTSTNEVTTTTEGISEENQNNEETTLEIKEKTGETEKGNEETIISAKEPAIKEEIIIPESDLEKNNSSDGDSTDNSFVSDNETGQNLDNNLANE